MNNPDEIIGAYIRKLREAKEWSQSELGRRSGLSLQRISSLENGAIPKKKSLLDKVAAALEVSLDELTAGRVESEQKKSETAFSKDELRDIVKTEVRAVLGDELTGLKAILENLLSNDLLPAAVRSITEQIVEAHATARRNKDVLCTPPPNNRVKGPGQ